MFVLNSEPRCDLGQRYETLKKLVLRCNVDKFDQFGLCESQPSKNKAKTMAITLKCGNESGRYCTSPGKQVAAAEGFLRRPESAAAAKMSYSIRVCAYIHKPSIPP